ncbi:MAG TPA: YjbQ family protein [Actinomycetota bacterium]
MESSRFSVDTTGRLVTDLTERVQDFVRDRGGEGLLNVFLPHATCGLALMETGSGSERDLQDALDGLLPPEDRYSHRHGSTGHGRDHLLPLFISPSLTLPVEGGEVVLGTWQSIVLVDTNRENNRRDVVLSLLRG